jgi:AraC-like DNA-binding protein
MLSGFDGSSGPRAHVRERVEHVRAYLDANMSRDVDIPSVARAAEISPFYLTRIFKATYGVPPHTTFRSHVGISPSAYRRMVH